jgi:hypothetical protein
VYAAGIGSSSSSSSSSPAPELGGERRAAAVGDAAVADAAPVLVADDFFRPSCGLRERL